MSALQKHDNKDSHQCSRHSRATENNGIRWQGYGKDINITTNPVVGRAAAGKRRHPTHKIYKPY